MDPKAKVFAEEAIRAVGAARCLARAHSIAQAFEADHMVGALTDAIYLACAEIEEEREVSPATWNTLADAVDTAELLSVVEANRTN